MHGSHRDPSDVSLARVIRFGAAGVIATFCYFVMANALVWSSILSPLSASLAAYLISLVVSYLLQSRFTFGLRKDSVGQMTRFSITSIIGLCLCWVITYVTAHVLGWPYFAGTFLICILIPVVNYSLFQGWVFATGLGRVQQEQNRET
jgi:putative flippase GtrA